MVRKKEVLVEVKKECLEEERNRDGFINLAKTQAEKKKKIVSDGAKKISSTLVRIEK